MVKVTTSDLHKLAKKNTPNAYHFGVFCSLFETGS